ncbi:MAG: undecaprenyl-diphosphate phosphatase [Clostridia bacterium]|nr:undecaprenyl-diphosphate phosphatase [Clostridia bacterium]
MLETIKITILSVVHGLTSVLPVSSLAHFSLLKEVFGFTEENFNAPFYYAVFSLGTALALYLSFFRMHSNIVRNMFKSKNKIENEKERAYKTVGKNVVLSLIPLLVLMIPISKTSFFGSFNIYFLSDGSLVFVGIASIFCAILMFISFWYMNQKRKKKNLLSVKDAIAFGIYQLPAYIFPGFSHVGIGASRMAVSDIGVKNILKETYVYIAPAYLLVNLFRAVYYGISSENINLIGAIVGFVVSLVLSSVVLTAVNYFTKRTYTVFCVYTLIFGVAVTVTSVIQMFV